MVNDDTRMIPPDIDENDAPTPTECFEECIHASACINQFDRLRGKLGSGETYSIAHLVRDLGCGEDCDEYDYDDTQELIYACRRLVSLCIENDVKAGARLKGLLRRFGIRW